MLLLTGCLLCAGLYSQQIEGISETGQILIMGQKKIDVSAYVKHYVDDKITVWQKKGEFEKTADYQMRVNEQTQKILVDSFAGKAMDVLTKIFEKTIDWHQLELKDYDADNETFLLVHPVLGQIAMPVAITSAQTFKQQFGHFDFSDIKFTYADDRFILARLKMVDQFGKSFVYDNQQTAAYVAQRNNYVYSNVAVKVPQQQASQQTIKTGSDSVDLYIPEIEEKKQTIFAVIIGNETYANERSVPYSRNDATIFKKYMVKTIGLPEENVHLVLNGTLGQILGEVKWITDVAKAYNGKASLIFYYAGHGMPDETSKDAFLLPVDGNSQTIQTGVKLEWLYTELNKYPTKQTTVFMDACFSGGARDGMLAQGRGVKIKPKENAVDGNFIVFSATTGDQTAYPLDEKDHGLFTYYLLKKIQESKGEVTYGELSTYIKQNVEQRAVVKNNKPQTPMLNVSYKLQDTWSSLKLTE